MSRVVDAQDNEQQPTTIATAPAADALESSPADVAKKHRRKRERKLRNVLEDRRRRHASDVIQLVIAFLWFVLVTVRGGHKTEFDKVIQQVVNAIPHGLDGVFKVFYFGGGVWIILVAAAALLLGKRYEAAGQVFVAGWLAWAASAIVGWSWTGVLNFSHATITTTPDAPVTRVAVVVAVTLAASPFVPRPIRRLGLLLAALVGFSSIYLGYRQASAVVAGFLVGWIVCKVVQLVRGTPEGLPTVAEIDEAMADLGVPITQLEQVAVPFGGAIMLRADGTDGTPYRVEAAGRDQRDTQVLVKASRWLMYKDSGPRFTFNRLEQLEHEAYLSLLAWAHKVRVPEIVTVGMAGPGTALLVERDPEATPLAALAADNVTDTVLDAAWTEIQHLHEVRIAHGALTTSAVTCDADGRIWIEGFALASSAAGEERIARDRVEFLVSTALVVGAERALAAAQRAIGNDALIAVLPLIQPVALVPATRKALKGKDRKGFLKDLIAKACTLTNTETPQLEQLRRISPATLFMALGSIIAVYALMVQVGDPAAMWQEVKDATWIFIVLAGIATLSTNITYAVALVGTVPPGRIKYGTTSVLELATSFANVAVPGGVGTSVFVVRYLQRVGLDVTTGVTAMMTTSIASGVVQIALFLACLPFASNAFSVGAIPSNWPVYVLLAILAVGVIIAIAFGVPALRKRIVPVLARSKGYLVEFLRSPRQLFLNLVGNLGCALLSVACFGLCVRAFGGHTSFAALVVINIGSSTISNMVPVPGGLGVGALGRSAGLVAVGVPQEVAVPAVLAQQLLSVWLPVLPGWFATRALMKREYL